MCIHYTIIIIAVYKLYKAFVCCLFRQLDYSHVSCPLYLAAWGIMNEMHMLLEAIPRNLSASKFLRCTVRYAGQIKFFIIHALLILITPTHTHTELTPPPSHLTKSYVPLPRFTLAQPDDPDTPVTNV